MNIFRISENIFLILFKNSLDKLWILVYFIKIFLPIFCNILFLVQKIRDFLIKSLNISDLFSKHLILWKNQISQHFVGEKCQHPLWGRWQKKSSYIFHLHIEFSFSRNIGIENPCFLKNIFFSTNRSPKKSQNWQHCAQPFAFLMKILITSNSLWQ